MNRLLPVGVKTISGSAYTAVLLGQFSSSGNGDGWRYLIVKSTSSGGNTQYGYFDCYGKSNFDLAWSNPGALTFSDSSVSVEAELDGLLNMGSSGGATLTNYALESGGNLASITGSTSATAASAATVATNTGAIATDTATVVTNTGATATNTATTAASVATVATNTGTIATNTTTIATNTGRIPALGLAAPASSVPVVFCSDVTVTGPAAQTTGNNALTGDGSATSCEQYNGLLLQILSTAGVTAGAVTFEQSADGTNWVLLQVQDVAVQNANPVTSLTIAASTTRLFAASLFSRFIRVRVSTTIAGGGSIQAIAVLSQNGPSTLTQNVQQATASNLNATVVGSGNFTVVGAAGHSAASSGNPIRVAGRVNTAVDTTLVAGDVADLFVSSSGQLVQKPYAVAELDWQYTGVLTTTTAQAVRTAGAAGVRNYVTGLQYQNTNATATTILVQDGTTTIAQFHAPANMALPAVIGFATPLRGTAATALNVNCGTAASNLLVNVQGYQAV